MGNGKRVSFKAAHAQRACIRSPPGPASTKFLTMALTGRRRGEARPGRAGAFSRGSSQFPPVTTLSLTTANKKPHQSSSPDDRKAAPHGHFQDRGRLSTIRLTIGPSHNKTPHFDRVNISPSRGNSLHLCLQKNSPLTQNGSPFPAQPFVFAGI